MMQKRIKLLVNKTHMIDSNTIFTIDETKSLVNVYFFGECYFQKIKKRILENNPNFPKEFILNDISFGNGSCFDFISYLRSKPQLNRGIFFLGGSIHDRHGWSNGESIKEVKKWFDTYFYDSILVFCLTGPFNPRPEHSIYNHNFYNEEKIKTLNSQNIFCLDLRFDSQNLDITQDGLHLTNQGANIIESQILEYLVNKNFYSEKFCIVVKKIVKQIEIKENYKKIYIIHKHNNNYFSVFNNDACVKKYVIFGCSKFEELKEQGYLPHLDRMIIDKINCPKVGNIHFSDPVYVENIIIEV